MFYVIVYFMFVLFKTSVTFYLCQKSKKLYICHFYVIPFIIWIYITQTYKSDLFYATLSLETLFQSYLLLIILIWSSWLLHPWFCRTLFLRPAVCVLLGLYPAIQFCLVVLVWTSHYPQLFYNLQYGHLYKI